MSEMVPMYGFGGGIDNLKFRVYAAASLPASGKENDVCIITSTPISWWEVFPVTPTWASDNGHVYIQNDPAYSGDYPNVNIIKKNGGIWLYFVRCWQYENGTWSSKDAYQYRNGAWAQFSTTFRATIHVTYPAGSTCTATDGTTTLATQNTSGTWSCLVPNSGTWTVSCTNGEYTAKSTVSITSNGQNSTAKLSYDQYLFKNGNQYTNITGGWVSQGYYQQSSSTGTGAGTLSVVNNILTLKEPDNSWHIAGTRDKVDLRGYSTLRFVISAVNASDAYLAARDDGRYVFPYPSIRQTCPSPGTYNIDISSANSSYYIQFYRCNVSEVLLKR